MLLLSLLCVNIASAKDDFQTRLGKYQAESNWSKKSEMIIDLCLESESINFDDVKKQATLLLDKGIQLKRESLINSSRFVIAFILNKESRYDEALDLFYQCERYYQYSNDERNLAYVKVAKGHSFYYKGLFKEAINQYKSAKLLWESVRDKIEANQSDYLIAISLMQLGQLDKAEAMIKECLTFILPHKKYRTISSYYSQLGELYSTQKKQEDARYNFNLGAEFALKSEDPGTIARAENYLAISAYYQGNVAKAIELFESSLNYRRKSGEYKLVCESYYNIASLYLEEKNFDLAEKYFLASIEEAKSHFILQDQADALLELSNLFKMKKDLSKAYDYLNQYVAVKDKIEKQLVREEDRQTVILEKLSDSKLKLSASEKQSRLELEIKLEKRRNSVTLFSGITIILVLGIVILVILSKRKS